MWLVCDQINKLPISRIKCNIFAHPKETCVCLMNKSSCTCYITRDQTNRFLIGTLHKWGVRVPVKMNYWNMSKRWLVVECCSSPQEHILSWLGHFLWAKQNSCLFLFGKGAIYLFLSQVMLLTPVGRSRQGEHYPAAQCGSKTKFTMGPEHGS